MFYLGAGVFINLFNLSMLYYRILLSTRTCFDWYVLACFQPEPVFIRPKVLAHLKGKLQSLCNANIPERESLLFSSPPLSPMDVRSPKTPQNQTTFVFPDVSGDAPMDVMSPKTPINQTKFVFPEVSGVSRLPDLSMLDSPSRFEKGKNTIFTNLVHLYLRYRFKEIE